MSDTNNLKIDLKREGQLKKIKRMRGIMIIVTGHVLAFFLGYSQEKIITKKEIKEIIRPSACPTKISKRSGYELLF